MSSKVSLVIVFVIGVAAGSAGTWQYVKKKYEQIAQEEIDSVKETFARLESERKGEMAVKTAAENLKDSEKPGITEYAAILQRTGYTDYAGTKQKGEEGEPVETAYVISPEEFGEDEEYERISLTYYADKVLADENDEMVEDVDDAVGFESLNHFGEYEDDSVYVKNNARKCYFEILLDERSYSEVVQHMPHPVEVR